MATSPSKLSSKNSRPIVGIDEAMYPWWDLKADGGWVFRCGRRVGKGQIEMLIREMDREWNPKFPATKNFKVRGLR